MMTKKEFKYSLDKYRATKKYEIIVNLFKTLTKLGINKRSQNILAGDFLARKIEQEIREAEYESYINSILDYKQPTSIGT